MQSFKINYNYKKITINWLKNNAVSKDGFHIINLYYGDENYSIFGPIKLLVTGNAYKQKYDPIHRYLWKNKEPVYNLFSSQKLSKNMIDSNGIIHYYYIECLIKEDETEWKPSYHRININGTISWKNSPTSHLYYYCPVSFIANNNKFPTI
mgnify:CR=1 FL=1